jgi:hypothetical protein
LCCALTTVLLASNGGAERNEICDYGSEETSEQPSREMNENEFAVKRERERD